MKNLLKFNFWIFPMEEKMTRTDDEGQSYFRPEKGWWCLTKAEREVYNKLWPQRGAKK